MRFTEDEIKQASKQTGFKVQRVEKVLHLLYVLDQICHDSVLSTRFALKGGTALNLFALKGKRLSMDLDFNYIGNINRDEMLNERPLIEKRLQLLLARSGYESHRVPGQHAGGKWKLSFTNFHGRKDSLEIDMNYMLRMPLFDVRSCASRQFGHYQTEGVPVLDIHELAAGKLSALMSRCTPRDVFDVHELLSIETLNTEKLRLAFTVYAGMNRVDFRTCDLNNLQVNMREFSSALLPTLQEETPCNPQGMLESCKAGLCVVLPLSSQEIEFLTALNDQGEIMPEFLTGDQQLQERIRLQPMLHWKAANVKKHKASPSTSRSSFLESMKRIDAAIRSNESDQGQQLKI